MPARGRAPLPAGPHRRRSLLGSLLLPLVAGCGFQLRGAAPLPFDTVFSAAPPGSPFGAELRRALRLQGATITETREAARVRVDLLGEALEREITALSTSGRPREYQIRLRVRWQARDAAEADLIAPNDLVLRRPITALDAQGVVSQDEEVALVRDMRADAVRQIVRRLSTVKLPP